MIYLKSDYWQTEAWVKIDSITAITKEEWSSRERHWVVRGSGFKLLVAPEDLPVELKNLMEKK